MLHNVPVQVDLANIQHQQQLKVNENLLRVNAHCYRHDYKVGERVMIVSNTLNWRTGGTIPTEYVKFIATAISKLNFQLQLLRELAFAEANLIESHQNIFFIQLNHRGRVK